MMMISVLMSCVSIAIGFATPLSLAVVEAPGLTGRLVNPACDHCVRKPNPTWTNGTVPCPGSITIAANFNGGQDGQCGSPDDGCDPLDCIWRGTITVTNGSGAAVNEIRIKLDGVNKKTCKPVPNGGQCQWDFTFGNPGIEIACGAKASSKKIVVEVVLPNGATCSKKMKLTCNACPEGVGSN